jgi:hypothetical protein
MQQAMRLVAATTLILLSGSLTVAQAQTGASSSGTTGAAASSGTASANGNTLSNGSTISGTGGSPGPNTSNALNRGTTENVMGGNQTNPSSAPASLAAVSTPAANSAVNSLSNTDAGVLKK